MVHRATRHWTLLKQLSMHTCRLKLIEGKVNWGKCPQIKLKQKHLHERAWKYVCGPQIKFVVKKYVHNVVLPSVQFSSVSVSLRPHELQHARPPCPSPTPELTLTHVHQVGDGIQPSHPLSSPSPPPLSLSQHQVVLGKLQVQITQRKSKFSS